MKGKLLLLMVSYEGITDLKTGHKICWITLINSLKIEVIVKSKILLNISDSLLIDCLHVLKYCFVLWN